MPKVIRINKKDLEKIAKQAFEFSKARGNPVFRDEKTGLVSKSDYLAYMGVKADSVLYNVNINSHGKFSRIIALVDGFLVDPLINEIADDYSAGQNFRFEPDGNCVFPLDPCFAKKVDEPECRECIGFIVEKNDLAGFFRHYPLEVDEAIVYESNLDPCYNVALSAYASGLLRRLIVVRDCDMLSLELALIENSVIGVNAFPDPFVVENVPPLDESENLLKHMCFVNIHRYSEGFERFNKEGLDEEYFKKRELDETFRYDIEFGLLSQILVRSIVKERMLVSKNVSKDGYLVVESGFEVKLPFVGYRADVKVNDACKDICDVLEKESVKFDVY